MFPQQTQTANRAGSMGHCKDRLLWLLHNYEALGQLVAIKIMEDPPHSTTLDPRNRDSGSEQSSWWHLGTQRMSESGLPAHHLWLRSPGQPQNRTMWSERTGLSVRLLSQENTFFSFSLVLTRRQYMWAQGEPEVCSWSVKSLWWWE